MPDRPSLRHAALAAALTGITLALPSPASAQMSGFGWGHGGFMPHRSFHGAPAPSFHHGRHHHAGPQVLPPGLAVSMLRRQGFREAGPLALRGETIVVAAVEAGLGGGPVMVVMDAYDGEVLSVRPLRAHGGPSATGSLHRSEKRGPQAMPLPPPRPRQIASVPSGAQATPASKPAIAYPPAEATALKKLARPAQ